MPAGSGPSAVVTADFNRRGKLDIAVTDFNDNQVSILLGVPGKTFSAKTDYATGASPAALVTADFDGDGKLDLAIVNEQDNSVSVLLGNGDGSFASQVDYSMTTGKWI